MSCNRVNVQILFSCTSTGQKSFEKGIAIVAELWHDGDEECSWLTLVRITNHDLVEPYY